MPGIIALIAGKDPQYQQYKEIIKKMTSAILHEDFYSHEYHQIPELGLIVSNVLLSDSPQMAVREQNFKSRDKNVQCFFSGELFSVDELRGQLTGKDRVARNRLFSYYIEELYEEKGISLLRDLNGYFSLVLADLKQKKVFFANDRFGIQRAYFSQTNEGNYILAPELKCFKFCPDLRLNLDEQAVISKFKFNSFQLDETYYREIKRFPIASMVEIHEGSWKLTEYRSPETEEQIPMTDFLNQSRDRLVEVMEDYYDPQCTGLSLTGGFDTRAILSVFHKRKINLPCYTFGGMLRDSQDVKLARKLAKVSDNPYYQITLGDEFLQDFPYWAEKAIYVSDGLTSILRCQEYYCNLEARKYGAVRLTGKYGSQLIRGVSLLKDRWPDLQIFSEEFKRTFLESTATIPEEKNLAYVIRNELPQHESIAQSQEMAAILVRTPYLDNKFVDLMLRAPDIKDTSKMQKMIIAQFTPEWANIPTNRGNYVKDTIKAKIHQKWALTLIMSDRVYNSLKLPHNLVRGMDILDLLRLSSIFRGYNEFRHYRLWFRDQLGHFVEKVVLDDRTLNRPYYNSLFLERMVKAHLSGKGNYTQEIDKVMSLELWLRQNES